MRLTIRSRDEDYEEIELPAKYAVCGTCEGKGTHVNLGVDGHGLSAEDFDQDPDFREEYFSGAYDVRCEECAGERLVTVIDEEACTAEQVEQHWRHCDDEAAFAAECANERKQGC